MRKVSLAMGAIIAALTASIVAPVSSAAPMRITDCQSTIVFETDGYGFGQSVGNWNNSAFNHAAHPGVQITPVPYEDGVFPVKDHLALDAAVAGGMKALDNAVRQAHASCPGTHLTLAGYSEGAVVAGNEINNLAHSGDIPHDQLNGVLYGNPRRPFGNGGRGGVAGGIETNIPSILPGVTMQGPQDYGDIAVRDVCNENDGICNSTNMITNLAAFANGLDGYYSFHDHAYNFDPLADTGNGLTFNPQDPRIAYGAPLPSPVPVGTPWQMQQVLGSGPARAAVVTARDNLKPLVPADVWNALQDSPWFQLINSA